MINAKNYEFRLKRMEKKMIIKRRAMGCLLIPLCYLLLSACGSGSGSPVPAVERPIPITATLTGLEGDSVVIGLNGNEFITLTTNESFSFFNGVKVGDAYNVTVSTQPSNPSQFCTVTNGSGTVIDTDALFNGGIDDIEITCVTLIALTSVNGTWLGECQVDGDTSSTVEQALMDGDLKLTVRTFSDTLCNALSSQPFITGTYTLGGAVSVDGSVDGITTATQVNSVFENNTLPADFGLVAIKGDKLYLGLNGADGSATDGTSAAKVFTKQP